MVDVCTDSHRLYIAMQAYATDIFSIRMRPLVCLKSKITPSKELEFFLIWKTEREGR